MNPTLMNNSSSELTTNEVTVRQLKAEDQIEKNKISISGMSGSKAGT